MTNTHYDGYWSADPHLLVDSFTGHPVTNNMLTFSRNIRNWMDNIGGIIFHFCDKAQQDNPKSNIKVSFGMEVLHMLYDCNVYEWDDCNFLDPNVLPNKVYGAIRNPDERNGEIDIVVDGVVLYKVKVLHMEAYNKYSEELRERGKKHY